MFVNFFIDRPIFASVLAIVIVVAGAVAIPFLPIAMFPEITPPQVVVAATYPGASAEVVEQTVTTPIEQQVNGVEDMIYMSSRSGSDGTMTLNVTFKVGTDLDIAAVNVQNRVSIAQAKLPADVTRQGLNITKQSPDLVEIVALISPDGSRDELYLANFATLQVVDVLARVPGVGQVTVFNGRDYGMRLWLNRSGWRASGSPRAMWPMRSGSRTSRPRPGRSASPRRSPGSSSSTPSPRAAASPRRPSSRTSSSAPGPTARCSASATSPVWSWAPRATGRSAASAASRRRSSASSSFPAPMPSTCRRGSRRRWLGSPQASRAASPIRARTTRPS